jgi:hypothetical protein
MRVFGLRLMPSEIDRTLELLGANKVAIGWSLAPSLIDPALTRQQFKKAIDAAYPDFHGTKLAASVADTWRFLREMEVGDILVIPRSRDIYFARVVGPAHAVPDGISKDMLFQRNIQLLLDGLPLKRHGLPQQVRNALKFRHTTDDLDWVAKPVLELLGESGPVEPMKAVETKSGVRSAIKAWRAAFAAVGRTDHGFAKDMIWVDDLGIWLAVRGWKRETGFRFWNGLGDRPGGREDRNLIVEINPPDGGLPGRFQGMVATDAAGSTWLLHSGELNVRSRRVQLRAELQPGILPSVSVQFSTGVLKEYYVVAKLDGSTDSITRNTKRFFDACLTVRASSLPQSDEFLEARKKASDFEESIGTTIVPPQPQKEIDRKHARVWHALRRALKAKKFEVGYDRVSALAPDMYTTCENTPYLFEIKTGSGASDCLKGVGQLIVYEHILKRKYCKYLVLPGDIGKAFLPVLTSLEIGVVMYEWRSGKTIFKWPSGFAKS